MIMQLINNYNDLNEDGIKYIMCKLERMIIEFISFKIFKIKAECT